MLDYTQIDRLAGAHQRYLDDEAAEQYLQEEEEQAISNNPAAVSRAMERFSAEDWEMMSIRIGQLVSQFKYRRSEREQGILEAAQEIYDLCQKVISEQATINRQRAWRISL